jgi:hypothetical protein
MANIMHGYSYVTLFKINNESSSWKSLELENEYKKMYEIEYYDISIKNKHDFKVKPLVSESESSNTATKKKMVSNNNKLNIIVLVGE